MCLSFFSYIANLRIASVQIARRGGLLIERLKSLRTLEKLAIQILAIKTGPTVVVRSIYRLNNHHTVDCVEAPELMS